MPAKKAARAAGGSRDEEAGTRRTILDAALDCFARDGFEGASVPKIAAAAKVGHSLVHYHFKSKDGLWRAVVDDSFGRLMADVRLLESASLDFGPVDQLKVLIRALATFAARYPSQFALIMAEARVDSERFAWLQENYTGPFNRRLINIIERGQASGAMRTVPADHVSRMIVGAATLAISMAPDVGQPEFETKIDQHASWLLDIMLYGIVATPKPAS